MAIEKINLASLLGDLNIKYVKDVKGNHTGGGVMVDTVILNNGQVIGVSDDCVCLYRNVQHFHNNNGTGVPCIDRNNKFVSGDDPSSAEIWNDCLDQLEQLDDTEEYMRITQMMLEELLKRRINVLEKEVMDKQHQVDYHKQLLREL